MYTIVKLGNKSMRIIFTLQLWLEVYKRLEYNKTSMWDYKVVKSTSRWILAIVPVVSLEGTKVD
jgi:hypothetical protein